MTKSALLALIIATSFLSACAAPQTDRSAKLLALAGQETMQIDSLKERLTRQLNIAETQIQRDQPEQAIETMKGAIATLDALDKDLDDRTRLAGLVSISELSRAAHDPKFADSAIDRAIRAVKSIDSVPSRCEYVMGINYEIEQLRGKTEAANFLADAGPWAEKIKDTTARHQALSIYAWQLFLFDNYDAGRDMLRHDTDVAWRADTLLALSNRSWSSDNAQAAASLNSFAFYGEKLDYGSNFKEQQLLRQSQQPAK